MELLQFTPQFHQLITSSFIAALLLIAFIFSYNLWFMRSNYLKPTTTTIEDKSKNKISRKKPIAAKPPPEALGAWPVIGHFLLFTGKGLTHVTLGDMADKYGPAFLIRFGSHRTLVVSSWEMMKECFSAPNDKIFSNRESNLLWIKSMFYGSNSYGFSPYGPYWKELRKISTQKLLSHHRLDAMKHLQMVEVDASFKQIYNLCNKNGGSPSPSSINTTALVNMDEWLSHLMFNVIARMVSGYQSDDVGTGATSTGERFKVAMDETMRLMAIFAVSDLVPWLACVDRLRGLTRKMNRCGKDLDSIIGRLIEEHRQKRRLCRNNKGSKNEDGGHDDDQDFIDICLSIMEQSQLPGDNPEIAIKSIVLDMIFAGSHTTTLAMTWTLSLLLNHRHMLKKAKEEIDAHVGNERQVDDLDIHNLVYIQAIIKESMRLYPPSPLFERMTMEDCEVGGFHIPAGTRLFVNVWKMQRDPTVWEDPLEFRPERFLTSKREIDVKGQHYELIPFGAGRRICPGASFTLQVLHLVLARLIHGFEMTTPMDVKVDMASSAGLFSNKMTPLEVLITPRTA